MALGPIADVDVNRLYQFSHVPPARAIVEFGIGLLESIPADLLASFLYDCIKVFIFRRKQAGGSTTVEMLVYDDGDSRRTTMSVTTDSEVVALEALRAGMAIATQPDAPMFVKVFVAGVSGRPVMGHSVEGRLL